MSEEILIKDYEDSKLLTEYKAALSLMETRIKNFYSLRGDDEEVPLMTNRIKGAKSAVKKLRKKLEEKGVAEKQIEPQMTIEAILENENDIAGQRVVVLFSHQIGELENAIRHFPGMSVVTKKDYINNPKPNGYRSLHLIVSVEIYTEEGTKLIPVEVQIRTLAMHAWACLEHYMYKQRKALPDEFKGFFKQLAKFAEKFDEVGNKIWECLNKTADADN